MKTDRAVAATDLRLLATAIAAVTTVGICWGAGYGLEGALAGLGALGLALGAVLAASDRLARRALGSVLITTGLLTVLGGWGLAVYEGGVGLLLVVTNTVAVLAIGAAGIDGESNRESAAWSVRDSTLSSLPVTVGVFALATGVVGRVLSGTRLTLEAVTIGSHASLLSVLALSVMATVLVACAGSALERLLPDRTSTLTVRSIVQRVRKIPTGAYYVLVIGIVVLLAPGTGDAFESTLRAMGTVGALVRFALESGGLHLALLGVSLGAGVICLGWMVASPARAWFGPVPLRTVAFATGGLVVPPVAFALASLPFVEVDPNVAVWVPFGTLLTVVLLELLVIPLASDLRDWRGWLRRLGCGSMLVATFVGSRLGLAPIGVFLAVAGAITVWDLTERSHALRTQLGPSVDSRQSELVHAMGTVVVGGIGVSLAVLAMYGIGAVTPPGQRWHALAPVTLALLAVFALVGSIAMGSGWLSTTRSRIGTGLRSQLVVTALAVILVLGAAAVVDALDALLTVVLLIGVPIAVLWLLSRLSSSDAAGDFKQPPPGGY
ncbi:DUF7519 family protein [Natronosalvus rutilus]|uniref:Uncharacterized protein n=1 Tax=Natronosalvus rutilus TaxID=2953753 RepID=A0A9E7N9M3_9EURY|nr:hypothetical protein [Natronosalvus rutilus]UTF53029.1 hypothetical protein NGM29_14800 [Natronosalvus rutilus]